MSQNRAEWDTQSSENETCPPWTSYSSKGCSCSKDYFDGELKCDKKTKALSVLDCHCMTYDNSSDVVEVGACVEKLHECDKEEKVP